MTAAGNFGQALEERPKSSLWWRKLLILLEMIKIEHTVFALPFAFMGALLAARGLPTGRQAFFIFLAMVGARSTAMAFNRLVDQRYDALNPRTATRALPQGLISRRATIIFILASALLFFFAAAQLNNLALLLSPVALAVVLFYSYTKRFTWASHLFLGAALAIAPAAGWIAVRGDITGLPLLLSLTVLLWVAGFDILYSLQDEDFDRTVGLYSLPCRLGRAKAMRLALIFHLGAGFGFILVGYLAGLGMIFYIAAVLAGLLLLVEHTLLSPQDLSRLNHAFFTLNGLVGLVLGIATLLSVWP
ncbi:MAG TPA: 4-hydroxybenzoate octaprenyltransferase [Desulfobacterales bacterium]|nr:4-hydroxybenzoate octaprenyltransferase [Desulfobacterales bacterium]